MVSKTYYRYIWLLNLLLKSKRPLCFEEIQSAWLENPMSDGELPLRTFHEHRKGITEMFGVEIVCEKGGWNSVYSVKNPEVLKDNQLGKWLLDHYNVPQDFSTFYGMRDRILLEDIARGNQDYHPIIEAMKQNVEMEIDYQKYDGHRQTFHVQPYALKVYNRRWYLLGFVKERGELRTIALDRMQHMTLTDTHFEMPKDFDARKHFSNVVGIYVDKNLPVTKVRIRVYGVQVEYLRALPLHKSQEEVLTRYEEKYSEFTYRLCLTPELTSQLLTMGDSVEVIEPLELREGIKERISKMLIYYGL
jgi:hypothetical protein